MTIGYNKIFIQAGPTGQNDGFGTLINNAAALGIPVFAAASDTASLLFDLQMSASATGVPHHANFIPTQDDAGNRFDFDYTIYPDRTTAHNAWQQHAADAWARAVGRIPPELDKSFVTISLENEQREYVGWCQKDKPTNPDCQHKIPGFTGWADCIGWQAYYRGLQALQHGYNYAAFAFAGGNPEYGVWDQPGMLQYLRLCEQHPQQLGISLHEYSFADTLAEGWGSKIGRFLRLHDACDLHGIARPFIEIKEFGWKQKWVPAWSDAAPQIEAAALLYVQYENVRGAAIWTTSGAWQPVATVLPSYIPELDTFTQGWRYNGVIEPPGGNPPQTNLLVNPSFELGWSNHQPTLGGLINQIPTGWDTEWLPIGAQLGANYRESNSTQHAAQSQGVPEMVHKTTDQLPPDQQPGGANALILDGDAVYKVFHRAAQFGAILTPNFMPELIAGNRYIIMLPVQIHWHAGENPDHWNAIVEFRNGGDVTQIRGDIIGDRHWKYLPFTFDYTGQDITFYLAQLYPQAGIDFFIDDLTCELIEGEPPMEPPKIVIFKAAQMPKTNPDVPGHTTEQRLQIAELAEAEFGRTVTRSHDDAAIMVLAGNAQSNVVVFDPELPSQVTAIAAMTAAGVLPEQIETRSLTPIGGGSFHASR